MVALVDDWFETGSQARAARTLIKRTGASYVSSSIIVDQLNKRERDVLSPCRSLVSAEMLG